MLTEDAEAKVLLDAGVEGGSLTLVQTPAGFEIRTSSIAMDENDDEIGLSHRLGPFDTIEEALACLDTLECASVSGYRWGGYRKSRYDLARGFAMSGAKNKTDIPVVKLPRHPNAEIHGCRSCSGERSIRARTGA